MSTPLRIAILVVVAAAAGVAGFAAYRWHLKEGHTPPQSILTVPPVSRLMPDVTLPDLEGKPRNLSEWKGRPLLINFWATWCGPCRHEIPLLQKLRQEHAAQDFEVIGIAIDFRDAVASYVRQAGIEYPILVAERDAMVPEAFGVSGKLPTSLLVGRDGRIVAFKVGQLHEEWAEEFVQHALEAR